MTGSSRIIAWQPPVTGIHEVLHARFAEHRYPLHTHAAWTLLIVDDGMVEYSLERHEHSAQRSVVTLLPANVPHDGRTVGSAGLRKRVLYLDHRLFADDLIGAAVDCPDLRDPLLLSRLHQMHDVLVRSTEDLEAQSRFTLIHERLHQHLRHQVTARQDHREPRLARQLRDLLDAHVSEGLSLDTAAGFLAAHPARLVRAFSREYGMPPHRYLIGRRVDLARRLLLTGHRLADVARMAGFYDQPHLNRHFKHQVGISPAQYAHSGTSVSARLEERASGYAGRADDRADDAAGSSAVRRKSMIQLVRQVAPES